MSSDTSRKVSSGKAAGGFLVYKGRSYELDDKRVGVVKYIGKTVFKPGPEWIGFELTKGKGKNNGSVMGVDYFKVDTKGQGAFVQLSKIVKEAKAQKTIKSTAKKAGAIETGKIKYDAAKFKTEDGGGFLGEKLAKATEVKKGDVEKKDGAIATGTIDYDAAKFETGDKGGDFLGEKVSKATDVKKGDVAHKDGALDTGRIDYETYQDEVAKKPGDEKPGDELPMADLDKPAEDKPAPAEDKPAEKPSEELPMASTDE